ncbi:MAG TPA: lysophospholipid acyltransferase family protein [Dissulfurispiraceae bacterium]
MRRIRWLLEIVLFASLSFPVAVLPYKAALKVGGTLGLLLFYTWGGRRRIAIENIRRAADAGALELRGSPRDIAKRSFVNLGRSFAEVAKVYYGLGGGIIHEVEVEGLEHFRKAKEGSKGVIMITGHCGNWELLALVFGIKVNTTSGVARAQDNPYLNRVVENIRAKYGNRVIYKKGALKGILSECRRNGVVGILMDQSVLENEGFIIDFLGRGAWTTKMPALISRKTGAAVVPAFICREGGRHVVRIYPQVPLSQNDDIEEALREDTKRFSCSIEDYIRRHPEEWLWIHRRWKRVEP